MKGEFVGGCDIMIDMFQKGDLNKLLISNKIISEADVPAEDTKH